MQRMKKLSFIFTLLIALFALNVSPVEAKSDSIDRIDMQVHLNKDGSAKITERRKAYLTEGTENYIVIENLGKSKITDFTVEENGEMYEFLDSWDINASRTNKTFKNGIITTSKGYELSWGIGDYGNHEYVLTYTVTDFIKQLDGSQILFWQFVNPGMNLPPKNFSIEITADEEITNKNEKIWAFGFDGKIEFEKGGKVVAKSDKKFKRKSYATVLIQFPEGRFGTTDVLSKTFEEVKEQAFEGSIYSEDSGSSFGNILTPQFLVIIFIAYFFLRNIFRVKRRGSTGQPNVKPLKNVLTPRKAKKMYEGEYNRDLPFDYKIPDIYYLMAQMQVANQDNLMTAFLLKWYQEAKVDIETEEKGFIKKKVHASIRFKKKEEGEDEGMDIVEYRLFDILRKVAGSDLLLEQDDYKGWTRAEQNRMKSWRTDALNRSRTRLTEQGYITRIEKRTFGFKTESYELSAEGKQLEKEIRSFMNYLEDFSLLDEHDIGNVRIWDQIMIWAALLNLTDEVNRQLDTVYPQYAQETVYSPSVLTATRSYSTYVASASVPRSTSTSRSGGGGFTGGGGGGGSFGGGSGGGTR